MNRQRKRSGRSGKQNRKDHSIQQSPWRQVPNRYKPFEVLDEDGLERIQRESLRVLREIGIEVLSPRALKFLEREGASVDWSNNRARLDSAMVEACVKRAPGQFRVHARNPAHDLIIGEGYMAFAPCGTPAYCSDLEIGRRAGTLSDVRNLMKLGQSLNTVHFFASFQVEPLDVPVPLRPLKGYEAFTTLTDKIWRIFALDQNGIDDAIGLHCLASQCEPDDLIARPALVNHITVNSPLRLDGAQADGLIEVARLNQVNVVTAFAMSGAMAPITTAGTLVQQNAEVLAAIVLAQCVRPGAPVVYGAVASNVDMRTGSPMFGTPEHARALIASGQLARRNGLPYRPGSYTASNSLDAQAIYESQMSLWSSMLSHGNMIFHALGWLEGGLTCSFEKMIIDAEMLQMLAEFMLPIDVSEDSLGFAAISEVGPGGHFFGTAHTLDRYEDAFYRPLVSDGASYPEWVERGSLSANDRATRIWKQLLADYQSPALDPAIAEEIGAYTSRREVEIMGQ